MYDDERDVMPKIVLHVPYLYIESNLNQRTMEDVVVLKKEKISCSGVEV